MKFGFTLIEIVVVIIIIGIMATIAITHYGSAGEQTYDRMAQADLRLLRAAERVYNMEFSAYYISGGPPGSSFTTGNINTNLKLSVPTGNTRKWNYLTVASVVPRRCCAQATRNIAGGRTWKICNGEEEPILGPCVLAACP
jgi:prepilin-type N-terminal cleavage/methylation domain-containing protein